MSEKIPAAPSPLVSDVFQAGDVHMAESDLQMAQETQAIAFRCSGNYVSHAYPTVWTTYLPSASMSAVQTWTTFQIAGEAAVSANDFDLPFRQTEGYSQIGAIVVVLAPEKIRLGLRLQTKTLAGHTVTTTSGDPVLMTPTAKARDALTRIVAARDSGDWLLGGCIANVRSPNLGASGTRRFIVTPQAYVADADNQAIQISDSVVVYLSAITLFEIPPAAVGT